MLFRKPCCTFSHRTGTGGQFSHPTRDGDERWAVLQTHGYFPRQERAFCSLFVLQECFAQHVQEAFPAPGPRRSVWQPFHDSAKRLSLQLEIVSCSSASTPLYFSRCHVPFGSSFHHPDVSPFSFLWNFFYFSPCRVLGFEGLGTTPGSSGTAVGQALPGAPALSPFPRGFGCARLRGLQGRSVQGSQEPQEMLTVTSTICLPTWGTDTLEMSPRKKSPHSP